ncbi:MAG: sodium:proline symporter, partial [Spirochaetaceae bacterium]|nr:sodium:proline symporter [Spirochaetaceae bacterium]
HDIYKGLIKRDATPAQILTVSRIAVLAISAIAFVLAWDENSSIFGLVSYAWAGFGATFGPLVLLALFWRGATAKGATAGLIVGGVTVILWHNLQGGIFAVYEILPAFILCLVATVVVSLLDKNKDSQMLAEFDAYRKLPD